MAAVTAITINDGAATPVAHTFDPTGPDDKGVQHYEDRVGGVALGMPRIAISKTDPRGAGTVYRVKANIDLPVLETATGTDPNGYTPGPKVAYTLRVKAEFILPQRSATAERADVLAYAENLLAHAVLTDMVEDLEGVW